MSAPSSFTREELIPQFQQALEFAASQAGRIVAKYPGYTPMYTVGGHWNREGERWTHWCEGFFPGILWLLHSTPARRNGAGSRNVIVGRWNRADSTAPSTIWAFCSFPLTCGGIT